MKPSTYRRSILFAAAVFVFSSALPSQAQQAGVRVNDKRTAPGGLTTGSVYVRVSYLSPDNGKKIPVKGATVYLWDVVRRKKIIRTTGQYGEANFGGLKPGVYQVVAGKTGFIAPAAQKVRVRAGRITYAFVTLSLKEAKTSASLTITVLTRTGDRDNVSREPVTGATVHLWDNERKRGQDQVTGPTGVVTFNNLVPGEYQVIVLADGYKSSGAQKVMVRAPATQFTYYMYRRTNRSRK